MNSKTSEYLDMVRLKTGLSDYKIAKKYDINQSNLSKYSSGKAALSETHAWLFANILDLDPARIVANTKLEHAINTNNKSKAKFWQEQLNKILADTQPIKIQIAQFHPVVGDISNNAKQILDLSIEAHDLGAHMVVFPELALTGYPPEDLLLRSGLINQVEFHINELCKQLPSSIAVLFGAPCATDKTLHNSAYCIHKNKVMHVYHKQSLPNYGVFDEKRYFSPGDRTLVFEHQGSKIGVLICEDAWVGDPLEKACLANADLIISLNASPFQSGKSQQRLDLYRQHALKWGVDLLYVNSVGGQDELVFDGGSFMMNAKGKVVQQLPFFESCQALHTQPCDYNELSETALIYNALVLATKDYVTGNGFVGSLIGLSGGIDSALTLAVAVDALGAENVSAVMMPYQFTSGMSLEDAEEQARTQGVHYLSIDIHQMVAAFNLSLFDLFDGADKDTTEENIQARVRGVLLMALSNKWHKMVLATGNKSEMSVGYATLYGDMCGGFAPLKDISKTLVYQLANYRNSLSKVIPERVITRPPSAELAPDQVDQDSLPPYDALDDILMKFVEQKLSVKEISQHGHDAGLVRKVTSMVLNNEYKRRQSAPGPKVSPNAFGKERRYPMTSKFRP
ncbi:MAG: NAD+ synthase [Gammaproteobacteria bacterium]